MGYVISLILLIVFIVFIIILRKRQTNEINNIRKITIKELTKQELEKLLEEQKELQSYYDNERIRLEEEYRLRTKELIDINENINKIKISGRKEVDADLLLYKKQQLENIQLNLNKIFDEEKENFKKESEKLKKTLEEQLQGKKNELDEYRIWAESIKEGLSEEIKDYKAKREIINKQILMERELKEKADFYRIVISEGDLADLKLIKSFEEQFHNKEILNRAAFDTFIKKPMNEMIKRVLGGHSPSGIYMITNLLTDEIYIGRAVSVDKRWQEHCKSCFNLGTIAHSTLHTRMAKEGIWNFSFQLLEEVPKDKLAEREKYWINFYQTKEYGMNEKAGG